MQHLEVSGAVRHMHLIINKCTTVSLFKTSLALHFSNCSNSDISISGYINAIFTKAKYAR